VVQEVGDARRSVLVQEYNFTSVPIADSLIEAKGRGIDVRVILDERANRTDKRSQAARLVQAGVPVLFDGRHPIMHDKIVVVDSNTVLMGSMNASNSGDKSNSENLLTARDPWLAAAYRAHWYEHAAHADPARR
jgi:phosphatidylserine/phosphatidylglycerophosphate/cardiolipin synthase-like enzyme